MAPYLALVAPKVPQRKHDVREVVDARRRIVWTGAPWRCLPTDFRPWQAVSQQTQRWLAAGGFDAMVHDLRVAPRRLPDRAATPTAAMFGSAARQSTPDRGHRAIDSLGHLPALYVTPANARDPAQVEALAAAVQDVTGQTVELAHVDQGCTGDAPAQAAAAHGIPLEAVKLDEAKRGFVLLPRRWVVERSFAGAIRFRRLAKGDERLPETVKGLSFLALACLMLHRLLTFAAHSPKQALGGKAAGGSAAVTDAYPARNPAPGAPPGRRRPTRQGRSCPPFDVGVPPAFDRAGSPSCPPLQYA